MKWLPHWAAPAGTWSAPPGSTATITLRPPGWEAPQRKSPGPSSAAAGLPVPAPFVDSTSPGADVPSAETGIWLGRSFRSRGIGTAALDLVLAEARRAGLRRVTARTLAGNHRAQRLLAAAGAALSSDGEGTVLAVVDL